MQPLHPSGNNVTDFLIQQYTSRHPQWDYAESWFKRIDPDMTLLSTPLKGNTASTVTRRTDGTNETNVNINLQGSGIQNAATIIAAVVFSPDDSTIIIEEPENFLQYSSVEGLIDLFNDIIATTNKQIILITHSWDILTTYVNDIGNGLPRTGPAVITNSNSFRMTTVRRGLPQNKVEHYDIKNKNIGTVIDDIKGLLENPAT
jgi:Fe-S cluster assembly ATPase SufC